MKKCRWNCGRKTGNRSQICDDCWIAAGPLRTNTDEGHRAWCERRRMEAAKAARPRTAKQQAHLDSLRAARRAKLAKETGVEAA